MLKKDEFVKKVKETLMLSSHKEAAELTDKFMSVIEEVVKSGEEFMLGNVGRFVITERAAHKGRNPQTGELIDIPAKKVIKFKPSGKIKEAINESK